MSCFRGSIQFICQGVYHPTINLQPAWWQGVTRIRRWLQIPAPHEGILGEGTTAQWTAAGDGAHRTVGTAVGDRGTWRPTEAAAVDAHRFRWSEMG